MNSAGDSIPEASGQGRGLLRIVACGSVDDGKSTLIGRLLVETGSVPDDQLAALAQLSRNYGTVENGLDYALLLDGLEAEREQGITIDVAYRYFSTARRTFVVADTPGHEQYTRNMASGASNADLAVLLVDVRQGITAQTMRHSRIVALLGIRYVLLVINKMDLVGFDQAAFTAVHDAYKAFASNLDLLQIDAVPVSARHSDNIVQSSARMPWYHGPTLLDRLETIEVAEWSSQRPLRFPVQSVVRANDFRGYAGTVVSGSVARGDNITIARSAQTARIDRIVKFGGDIDSAEMNQAVTLVLTEHTDVGRGDLISREDRMPEISDQFAAHLIWFDETPLLPGRSYALRIGAQMVPASVTSLRHKIDVETGNETAARILNINDIGFCNLSTATPVAFDPYKDNRATGAFILIDRANAKTVGAGMVAFALRRAGNIKQQTFEVRKASRAHIKAQQPCIVWFTGLPGAGKSTIMNLVEQRLAQRGVHTYGLDGDNLRQGLNRDLGFTDADRVENIRRAGEVARMMVDAGLIVLCAFISPFRAERRMVRGLVEPWEFIEIFVDTPLEVCMERDPKGLYARARKGQAFHVTGLDSAYERPEQPEIHVYTTREGAVELAERVVEELEKRNIIGK